MGSIRINISTALVTLLVMVSALDSYGAAAEQVNTYTNYIVINYAKTRITTK